jgi:hypothetical protein
MTDVNKQEIEWIEDEDDNAFRQGIFQTDDRQEVVIPVPEWKRKVLIKRLTGTARSEFMAFQSALSKQFPMDNPEFFKRTWFELARIGCFNPATKKPIFKPGDRDTFMNEHDGGVIEMLGTTVQNFSQLDGSVSRQAKKNLGITKSTTTTTNSQSGSEETTGESQNS